MESYHQWKTPPTVKIDDGFESLKHEKDWEHDQDEAYLVISRALNVIYNGVYKNIFKIINTCISPKEACKTIKVAYEGTSNV